MIVGLSVAHDPVSAAPAFSGEEAMRLIERQVAFGPRIPGTEPHAKMRDWLVTELEKAGARVTKRPFRMRSALTGADVTGTNIMARFAPALKERIFFAAHYDTREFADRDPDPEKRRDPVPGANDAGSGVAVLLHVARILAAEPPSIGVDLLFFDGEDQGSYDDPKTFSQGARPFAASAAITGFRPQFGVLLDIVGGKTARFATDYRSRRDAPEVANAVYGILGTHLPEHMQLDRVIHTEDDHIPFLDAGIPCVVIFGSDDPNWHTTHDLPDGCSPEVLEGVGNTVLELIYEADKRP